MKILFLSHTYWDSLYRVGSHHLALSLAAAGHSILYISTPISVLHYLKYAALKERIVRAGKLLQPQPNLYTYIPLTPIPCGLIVRNGFDCAFPLGGDIRRICVDIDIDEFDLVLIDDPKLIGVLRYVKYKKMVYRPTDIYSQMGLKNWRQLESHLLNRCDAVVATSGPVLKFLNETFSTEKPGMVFVNGVDYELFTQPQPRPSEYSNERKRCVYVGILDFRFDFDALYVLATARADVDFYIIGLGEAQEITRFSAFTNVFFIGARPYMRVPAYLQHANVGLLPMRPIAANMGRSPMKLYEYLAAGLPVVSLQTDELRRRNTQRVFCYHSSEDILVAFEAALQESRQSYFEPELAWSRISQNMLSFIG
ncbi:MAG TPA: glycosyltransferase [Spongiibacteraceae bacterium]